MNTDKTLQVLRPHYEAEKRRLWEFIPDACFAAILSHLPPSSIPTLRLVSKSWRDQVSYTLQTLSIQSSAFKDVSAAFPNLRALSLTMNDPFFFSQGDTASWSSLRSLDTLTFEQHRKLPHPHHPTPVSEATIATALSALPNLAHLTFSGVSVSVLSLSPLHFHTLHSKQIGNDFFVLKNCSKTVLIGLKTLRLRGVAFTQTTRGSSFLSVLSSLENLESLEIDDGTTTLTVQHVDEQHPSSSSLGSWPATISSLKHLKEIRLGGGGGCVPLTNELCSAIGDLPHIVTVELSMPGWFRWEHSQNTLNHRNHQIAENQPQRPQHTTDDDVSFSQGGGLAALSDGAAATSLQRLVLRGCFPIITAAAWVSIGNLTALTSLDIRTYGSDELHTRDVTHSNEQTTQLIISSSLTKLKKLEQLHLGDTSITSSFVRSLRHLPFLSRLEFSSCQNLDDSVLFEVSKMRQLKHLALQRCLSVTDIGLAALAKGPVSLQLTALDLTGCHKNVSDTGIAALHDVHNLQRLDLSGCDGVGDAGIKSCIPGLRNLQYLSLSDTRVTDETCFALGSGGGGCSLSLHTVNFDHCSKVTERGILSLSSLQNLRKVQAFSTFTSHRGASLLSAKTGAQVLLQRSVWWGENGSADASPSTSTFSSSLSTVSTVSSFIEL